MRVEQYRIDWFRFISDISRRQFSLSRTAAELEVSKSTLLGWKMGSEPKHGDGEALIEMWCQVTGRDREIVPVVVHRKRWTFRR